jgi:formamidopyrimidine-DNA glycosylase
MPELPEVETVARGLQARIVGLMVKSVRLERTDITHGLALPWDQHLRGRRVVSVQRAGKHVRVQLDEGLCLAVHLGMTGRLTAVDAKQEPAKHTHLRIAFRGSRLEMRFCDPRRFGAVWLISDSPDASMVSNGRRPPRVAADPLTTSLREWRRLLNRRRQIKPLLLDQDPITGVGNIYCDEALHRAGIHPLSRASDLDVGTLTRLHRALRQVLTEAIAAGGSSVSDYRNSEDTQGWFQLQHRVYGRAGQPCRRCRTPIVRLVVAGRGTHICPRCQRCR